MDRNERGGRSRDESDRGGRDGGRDSGRSERDSGRGRGEEGRGRGEDRGGRGGSRYEYQRRDAGAVRKRAEQQGGDFDRFLKDGLKAFKTNEGDNTIRFLPPTWPKADHYGLDIFVHYGVGADQQTYVCPQKMKDQPCPICEEHVKAQKDGDEKYAKELAAKKRVLVYIIDREAEKDGVLIWSMPWTLDRDICKVSQVDKRSGETLFIDDPENGYDVDFERKGNKDRTEYIGVAIARRESPLGDSKWLQFAEDNPLPDQLIIYDYDHINKAFGGAGGGGGDRDRGGSDRARDDTRDVRGTGLRDPGDDATTRIPEGRSRGRASLDDSRSSKPTWDSIHKMTFDQMCELVTAENLRSVDPDKSKDDADLADWICEEMKITEAAPPAREESTRRRGEPEPAAEADPRDRLRDMRRSRE